MHLWGPHGEQIVYSSCRLKIIINNNVKTKTLVSPEVTQLYGEIRVKKHITYFELLYLEWNSSIHSWVNYCHYRRVQWNCVWPLSTELEKQRLKVAVKGTHTCFLCSHSGPLASFGSTLAAQITVQPQWPPSVFAPVLDVLLCLVCSSSIHVQPDHNTARCN